MNATLRVACAQVTATTDIATNIALATELVREAHGRGAQFVGLPEVVNLCDLRRGQARAKAHAEAEEPALAAFRALASELGIWLLAGSLVVRLEDEDRLANRSYLIDAAGRVVQSYDKIHMFDVDLEGGESYRESATFRPGSTAVLAETPWGPLGMTVCYDVRFAHLYRTLAQAGARLLTVPAAFTRRTGEAHWHVLLRARAVETGCFVVAPAQCGDHEDGRRTFGHSLIVSPWGEVLADGGTEPGVVLADLDLAQVDRARVMVPSLAHDRAFAPPQVASAAAE